LQGKNRGARRPRRPQDKAVRDEVTLIASGGIKRSEHVAKSLILGADLVAIDIAILLALQAQLNGEARYPETTRVTLNDVQKGPIAVDGKTVLSSEWASQRLANLVNSWKEQHIEILSAKGIRDVRRERGEIGRAMLNEIEEEELKAYIGGTLDP
jgi:glutamate synthase domain-containing protein 2